MGFRFQKRIRIFKGRTLNLSKSGTSCTLSGRGDYGKKILASLVRQFELKYAMEGGAGLVLCEVMAILPQGVFIGR